MGGWSSFDRGLSRLILKSTKLAVSTEEHLHSVVDLLTRLNHQVVECLGRAILPLSGRGGLFLRLFRLGLSLGSDIDDPTSCHLLLDLELESVHGLESGLNSQLLGLV